MVGLGCRPYLFVSVAPTTVGQAFIQRVHGTVVPAVLGALVKHRHAASGGSESPSTSSNLSTLTAAKSAPTARPKRASVEAVQIDYSRVRAFRSLFTCTCSGGMRNRVFVYLCVCMCVRGVHVYVCVWWGIRVGAAAHSWAVRVSSTARACMWGRPRCAAPCMIRSPPLHHPTEPSTALVSLRPVL
jgi:hypothetical protein